MKRALTVLAIMLMAATTFTQTSRRPASTNSSASREENRTTVNNNRESVNRNVTRESNTNLVSNTPTRQTTTTRTVDVNRSTPAHTNQTYSRPGNNHNHHTEGYTSSRRYNGSYTVTHKYTSYPESRDYRATHYVYRSPVNIEIVWTNDMHHHYRCMYPEVRNWHYSYGYRISSVSAYHADRYIGEVMNVYGRVTDVFYAHETDEYILNIGPYYPYQDFTIVLPGEVARRYGRRPVSYFTDQYISVTGLITEYEGKPEIVVKRNTQVNIY